MPNEIVCHYDQWRKFKKNRFELWSLTIYFMVLCKYITPNFIVKRYFLSVWPTDESFLTKSMLVPTDSFVFSLSCTKVWGVKFDLPLDRSRSSLPGSSCAQIMMDPCPHCWIPSPKATDLLVPEKKKIKGLLSYMGLDSSWSYDQDSANKPSFPEPMEPHAIWLQSAHWLRRRRCLILLAEGVGVEVGAEFRCKQIPFVIMAHWCRFHNKVCDSSWKIHCFHFPQTKSEGVKFDLATQLVKVNSGLSYEQWLAIWWANVPSAAYKVPRSLEG